MRHYFAVFLSQIYFLFRTEQNAMDYSQWLGLGLSIGQWNFSLHTAQRAVGEGQFSSSLSLFRFGNGGFHWGGKKAGSSSCLQT